MYRMLLTSVGALFLLMVLNVMPASAGLTTPDSSSVTPSSGLSSRILLIDGGYIGQSATANSTSQSFATRVKCPANFMPYMTIDVGKVRYTTGGGDFMVTYYGCIHLLLVNASNYTVTYYGYRAYAAVNQQANASKWIGTSWGSFTAFDSVPMFTTLNYLGYLADTTNPVAALSWRLYCYPPNLDPPLHQVFVVPFPNPPDPKTPWASGC